MKRDKSAVMGGFLVLCIGLALPFPAQSQHTLREMPGYANYARMKDERTNVYTSGAVGVTWKDGGRAVEFRWNRKMHRYDLTTKSRSILTNSPATREERAKAPKPYFDSAPRPARGRQYAWAVSPDGKHKASYRDRNLWLSTAGSTNEVAITRDGDEARRVKYGSGTWVYGEELDQNTAIWWSSNSLKVAFYRFDESRVQDYYLTLNHTGLRTKLDVEAYPKAGDTNPLADIFIYDLPARKLVRVDTRGNQPFSDENIGHYVYNVTWRSDSSELLFHRTNRRQNTMELCAANPLTGKCRVIVREEWLASWVENNPGRYFLKDGRRLIWTSERTGWKNFYLYDLSGRLICPLTRHSCEVGQILKVDESAGVVFYTARSGDNPMKMQLHRVNLDGTGDVRLTDPRFHHAVDIAPDFRHFVDVAESHSDPPRTTLRDSAGRELELLASSDVSRMKSLGMRAPEVFEFKAADGRTVLYGMLHYPSRFNPRKKYPLLVGVYAGPATPGAWETFTLPNILTEFGFLYASFDSRSASGRGKRFLDSIYLNLGRVEIDDQAEGVKHLARRRFVNKERVGIFGTSYGGTASVLCLLRYPEVFHAACASSSVGDFRNYDTIYTERYLWKPDQEPAAYDQVKLATHLEGLKGKLMLFYGTADDNVHPANTLQFVQSLQQARKSFDLQVGPDQGHTSLDQERMMEFFIEHLGR